MAAWQVEFPKTRQIDVNERIKAIMMVIAAVVNGYVMDA